MGDIEPLSLEQLRWTSDPSDLSFDTTEDLDPLDDVLGQDRAIEAIEFGIGIDQEGYNLFAFGSTGLGKHDTVRRHLEQKSAREPTPSDWCYVYNFDEPNEPRVLELPAGMGARLHEDMEDLIEEIKAVIPAAFESEDYQTRRQAIEEEFQQKQEEAFEELRREAEEDDITVIRTPAGIALAPVRDGEVIPPNEFDQLPEDEREEVEAKIEELQEQFEEALKEVPRWERKRMQKIRELNEEVTRFTVEEPIDELREKYAEREVVLDFLDEVEEDLIDNASEILQALRLEQQQAEMPQQMQQQAAQQQGGPGGGMQQMMPEGEETRLPIFRRYQVNVLVDNSDLDGAPVVYEDHPTLENLVGRVEYVAQFGALMTDFNLIRDGALHRANGGYLILDARKVLMNQLSWEQLKRSLFSDEVRVESTRQILGLQRTVSLEPEPVPLDAKVVLLGQRRLYYLLSHLDPEFSELFKVAADFEEEMDREGAVEDQYPRLLASYIDEDDLKPFDSSGIARVVERSVRRAGDREKLTTESADVRDLLREADYWAGEAGRRVVTDEDVQDAIDAQINRKSRIRDRMREQIERETILIDTEGSASGQVNALSVLKLDDYQFGRPNRITARVRLGKGEVVDIEREVDLGGPIHSKGVLILQGLLGMRYAEEQPLSLSASLVFEQSYGGIDGDSASLAEAVALLSSLAEVPVRQNLSVTGSINQHGRVQAVGGVNDKIEGFFDVCADRGLTGDQGVVVPQSNVDNLMLRRDVCEAVAEDQFQIYGVETVDEAVELLTGEPAGEADETGEFPEGTVNYKVQKRLAEFAETAREFASADED
ncbi:MAG: Lon protease family protein [Bradymonadaceae bacterium]